MEECKPLLRGSNGRCDVRSGRHQQIHQQIHEQYRQNERLCVQQRRLHRFKQYYFGYPDSDDCVCGECCKTRTCDDGATGEQGGANVDITVTCGVGDYTFPAVSSASTVSVGPDA